MRARARACACACLKNFRVRVRARAHVSIIYACACVRVRKHARTRTCVLELWVRYMVEVFDARQVTDIVTVTLIRQLTGETQTAEIPGKQKKSPEFSLKAPNHVKKYRFLEFFLRFCVV